LAVTPGTRLGVYEVTAPIGEGGMGQVFRAHDTKLNRDVALKFLPDAFARDPDRLARFTREAQTLAALNHPNIAAIYGIEESSGVRALVMELVEGEDLSAHIARGPMPLAEVLPIAKQIADALETAHEQGIIHRDLKPANIKLRPDGTVKVLDFGLAKAMEPASGALPSISMSPTITTPAMTQAGMILGTAAYMSPEQAKGRAADKRSDVWAFGCVLFEMLTGKRAFEGDDVSDTLAAVIRGEPDWTALPATTPTPIHRLLRRCLEKDRKERVPDIAVARVEIKEALAMPASIGAAAVALATQPRPLWRLAVPFVATAIVAVAIGGFAAWSFRSSAPPPTVTRFTYRLAEGQQFTNPGRQMVAISPDGTQMVYVATQGLYLQSMSETEARLIPGAEVTPGEGTSPVFSPDGRSIAFRSGVDQTLKRIDVRGGAVVTICPSGAPFGMSWGPDGILFGESGKGIMRVSANGGKPELLVSVKSDELAHGPQMLPGGQAVLFTLAATGTDSDRWDRAHVVVQTLKSGERKTLIDGGSDARYVSTGHLVYALGGTVFAVPFDLRRLEVRGGPVPIVEGVLRANFTGTAQFSVSSGGSLIYIPGPVSTSRKSSLALVDRKGAVETLKLPPDKYEHPRVSPEGKRLAYATDDGNDANVWTYDLSGASAPRRLTFGGKNRFPIWSADGERVVFQSDREGDLGIFWQRADGTDQAARLTKPDQGTSQAPESWSPDNKRFLFRVVKERSVSLWTFSIEDKKAAPFGDVRSQNPTNAVFSPDGRWVAYSTNLALGEVLAEAGGIFVQPFPTTGAKYQISSVTGKHPLWSPDGKELLYSLPAGFVAVALTTQPTFTVGNPVQAPQGRLFDVIGPESPRRYDTTPDGRILGIVTAARTPSGAAAAPEIQVVLNWSEELKQRVPTR
jgi:Tol biopolymer transport system component